MPKSDVLLLYPGYSYPRKSPPLGLAYLAAYLDKRGFKPYIHDFNVSPLEDKVFGELLLSRDWLLVGMSFMTNQFAATFSMARLIKKVLPEVPLVAGGPHASSVPERTLEELPGIDIVVKGEGELTLAELAGALAGESHLEGITGLYIKKGDKIINTGRRSLVEDLDSLPFPAWKYLEPGRYSVFKITKGTNNSAFALLSSRGCPNACTFCDSHTIFERRFRARSARGIFEEMMHLHNTYGMLEFDFVDDLITVDKARVLELCTLIRESGIDFKWMANARVNTVDMEMLRAMKEAGCIRVDYGVESGDPHVRKLMRKNITDRQIRDAHAMAQDLGISTGSFTMVGNLGETRDSAKMTVDLLKEIGQDVMVSIACPFPGTELYRTAKKKGFLNTEDWNRYVTSPTYIDNYSPVMRTENLTGEEILESFYYLHSFFARRKFQQRFGRYFYLNPRFYREWVFERKGLSRRSGMAFRLVAARIKRIFG